MNAICMVAHPDDCIIFGYSYMYHHPEYTWTIGYLTYTDSDDRAAEMIKFWQKKHIRCVFLGFVDHWHDQEHQAYNFWNPNDAAAACWNLVKDYDLVLTHDADGDYGHIHHRLVHHAVCQHHRVVYFVPPGLGNTHLLVPPDTYDIDELTLHRDIILPFHQNGHQNSYMDIL
jgi:LmbE family N-acetylglucosaminyl deacetylase